MDHEHRLPRIATELTDMSSWHSLISGTIDAVRLQNFASSHECAELLDFIVSHPRMIEYASAQGIRRLGTSFSDIRRTGRNVVAVYREPDILEEIIQVNSVIDRLFGRIAISWIMGVETLAIEKTALHRCIARRIMGRGAEAHDDDIAKEMPGEHVATTVKQQLGVNLYLETPSSGGELFGWHRRLTNYEYDANRIPGSYGLQESSLPAPDWTIKPSTGDVVIFNNSEIHSVRSSSEPRTTLGFFLGVRAHEQPLLIWS